MKSHIKFLQKLLIDIEERCCTSTRRDLKTIALRTNTEGESFLTITLPSFADGLHQALSAEVADPSYWPQFKTRGKLPVLLGGLLEQVFDRGTGRLREDYSVAAIQSVRQITMAFGKIKKECSNERIQAAYTQYVLTEYDVRVGDQSRSSLDLLDFGRMARLLWGRVCTDLDYSVRNYQTEITFKHGSGATADGLMGNQKWALSEWTDELEQVFPFARVHHYSFGQFKARLPMLDYRSPGNERPSKVTHVPKTLKTPRIIAEEPTCMMFVQQGLHAKFMEYYAKDFFARNFICYESQVPNQEMARIGSRLGTLATLDLKEASDRVSNQLVLELFRPFGHLAEAVQACRTKKANVLGSIIPLAKFASMGSALTFPVEAMVFCTLVFLGIQKAFNRPLTRRDISLFVGQVRVYGDDIVVPTEFVPYVMDTLQHFGAVVNSRKSFWTGRFRESCGEDFYAGASVKVARVRQEFPLSRTDGEELLATVSLRNQLFELGYERTVQHLDSLLQRILVHYPVVSRNSGLLGRWTWGDDLTVTTRDHDTQRPMVKAYAGYDRIPGNAIDGELALTKVFLTERPKVKSYLDVASSDPKHLTHSGRPRAVDIKLGMYPVGVAADGVRDPAGKPGQGW
jgi:hypothetical protein